MDLITISLSVLLIAMLGIVPLGCFMTRHGGHKSDEVID
jgi:hypothetical protein